MTKSPLTNVPDMGMELGAACMPSRHMILYWPDGLELFKACNIHVCLWGHFFLSWNHTLFHQFILHNAAKHDTLCYTAVCLSKNVCCMFVCWFLSKRLKSQNSCCMCQEPNFHFNFAACEFIMMLQTRKRKTLEHLTIAVLSHMQKFTFSEVFQSFWKSSKLSTS